MPCSNIWSLFQALTRPTPVRVSSICVYLLELPLLPCIFTLNLNYPNFSWQKPGEQYWLKRMMWSATISDCNPLPAITSRFLSYSERLLSFPTLLSCFSPFSFYRALVIPFIFKCSRRSLPTREFPWLRYPQDEKNQSGSRLLHLSLVSFLSPSTENSSPT